MPLAPHLEKIMKLLMLSGAGNPNVHERQAAKALAEANMARHGVTLQQMRDLYWDWSGLTPPKRKTDYSGDSPTRPGFGSRPGSYRSSTRSMVNWQRFDHPPPPVQAREARPGASKRTRLLLRIEEAVQGAMQGFSRLEPVQLPDFQAYLTRHDVRAVFHHNPIFLEALGYLEVFRLGFLVDDDPTTYAEGVRIGQGKGAGGLGLIRMLRLGMIVLPRAVTHHHVAKASLKGLAFPNDQQALRKGDYPFRILVQEAIDFALEASAGDLSGFLGSLRRRGGRLGIMEPERILIGLAPLSVSFEFQGNQVASAWLGAAYTWAGLLARGLRVDPGSRMHRLILEACARWG
jgi:hypothetical protein